jgi:hypothetical protein
MYRLLVGLYRPEDGVRLSLENSQDALMIGQLKVD